MAPKKSSKRKRKSSSKGKRKSKVPRLQVTVPQVGTEEDEEIHINQGQPDLVAESPDIVNFPTSSVSVIEPPISYEEIDYDHFFVAGTKNLCSRYVQIPEYSSSSIYLVMDTNVLMKDSYLEMLKQVFPKTIYSRPAIIYIPHKVTTELQGLRNNNDKKQEAESALNFLEQYKDNPKLEKQSYEEMLNWRQFSVPRRLRTADDDVLAAATGLIKTSRCDFKGVIFVSDDKNVRLKAKAFNVTAIEASVLNILLK